MTTMTLAGFSPAALHGVRRRRLRQLWEMHGSTINGNIDLSAEESWNYYAAEAKYNITPTLYGAARYSGAAATMLAGHASNGRVNRIQIGGGLC